MATKTKAPKKSKIVDVRFTPEQQAQWSESERKLEKIKMFNELNYDYTNKDLKPDVIAWMQDSNDYSANQIKTFSIAPDNWCSASLCHLARAWRNGWILDDHEKSYMKTSIAQYINKFIDVKEQQPKEKKSATPELTIQDRIKLKINEHIGHFEEQQDLLSTVGKVDPKAFAYLKKQNVPQNMLKGIAQPFIERLEEWKEAKAGTCEDLKEGYSHWQAKDYKKYFAFVEAILADIDAYTKTKKAVKVARVKKAPNKQKQVAKMKYAKDNTTYKIASVDPVTVIGTTELYVFNVKTRKLGKYVADTHMGVLGVKGTTIVGYDTSLSTQKTLRKPERQLPDFMGSSKGNKRKFLDGIKSVEIALNGRINSDTILLHVQ
jgi:hypothetical protein